jgi:predicted amidohydrolase
MMRITISQSRGQIDDVKANYAKMKMVVGNVDADIFVFPEMFLSGYVGKKEQFRTDQIESVFMERFIEYSKKRECMIICGGPLAEDGKVYNAAFLINGDDVKHYRKMHLRSDTLVREKELYAAGDRPFFTDRNGLRFGLAISHDLFFPELFRYYASNDVDIVICISAVPERIMNDYEKLIAARAVENSMNIIFVNMVGDDPGERMIGRSRWVSHKGEVVEGCTESSDVRQLRIDEEEVRNAKKGRTVLKDVRTDVKW